MNKQYFPQGIATDVAFCNRENERAALKSCIQSHEHVVLVAPRRYGKTSLVTQVLKESDFPGISIDFFFVLTQAEAVKLIMENVSKLINKILPKTKKTSIKIINSIKALNPKLTFNILGQKLEISTTQSTEKNISELLLVLDQFAMKVNKACVIVFDEFQQIGELAENHAIEAAIRHAVERSQYVSYIFCGSKRHLLNEMFSDKSRPLYHLCDLMTINRISTESYHKFLAKKSHKRWKEPLDSDVYDEIVNLTENHPYYVNALCRRLWRDDKAPNIQIVRKTWDAYVTQQSSWIISDLSGLTLNRRKIITALAHQPTNEPQGKKFTTRVGINPSGIKRGILDLERLDLIYKSTNGYYRVLDPAIVYFIGQNAL